MTVKIVMCEGPHDTAFVSRILRVLGCSNDKTQIGEFPGYLKEFLIRQYNPDVESFPVHNARNKTITPNYGLNYKDEVLFLLYNMGGDSKKGNRKKFSEYFLSLFGTQMTSPSELGFNVHIVYEFDADMDGKNKRVEQVNKELKEMLPDFPGIAHGEYCDYKNITWGTYIFSAPEKDTGKLEDMVLPLMREENEDLFADIEQVADKREDYGLYHRHKKKLEKDGWDKDKAMIGMAGQLHKFGNANAAIIEQSRLITDDQIMTDRDRKSVV